MREYLVSPTKKKKKGERSILDGVWFSMLTAVFERAAMCAGSNSHVHVHVGYDSDSYMYMYVD